ncbi:alpha mannosidase-like protein [Thermosporothrix hazakensis]|jgi:alpha-mannosidase|uniref:Alpha mannosidase-like protein n=1 Tax=Thermosporothrix hazakensis TaxID=644383 RepID=A0A326U662_THEHA|nr:glycoside hydrolase family 38 C-terminal domain-containing protein [Thermosporothrix hazakensis]PZW25666.1 alpha mannosidase-like protein [Thermosporothrix hazakensis]GCE48161.1 hypothetical protein KTH_30300 [Thermosporothrix hazakensis]
MAEQLHIVLVPHTHWDREWYQTFQQFRLRLVKAVDALLNVLEEDQDFRYFMLDGQTIVIDDYLEARPEQAERLKRLIRSGRILVGPWYIQPDEFLVSGESLIRNLQRGISQAEELGGLMRVGYVPDTFGHIAQLPQILRGVGIDNAVFWRGVGEEIKGSEFYWEAPDGSQVFVVYLADPQGYSNARQMPLNPEEFVSRVKLQVANLLPRATDDVLLFMNGSDHLEVQEGLPATIAQANALLQHVDIQQERKQSSANGHYHSLYVEIGTLPQYIERVRSQNRHWQVWQGELRSSQFAPLLPGVLSSRIWIKQQNERCEQLLERWVEPMTTFMSALNLSYPEGLVRLAWQYLLQNHPHDSICGCSIDQVHRENSVRFAQCQQICEGLLAQTLPQIAARVDTQPPIPVKHPADAPVPIVVFHPAPATPGEAVQTTVQLPGSLNHAMLLDEKRRCMPFRVVNRSREVLGTMPVAREMLASMVALSGLQDPDHLLQMTQSIITSTLGETPGIDEKQEISHIYIENVTVSPLHHEPHIPHPGVIFIEIMIAPKGRVQINRADLRAAAQQVLDLLRREDIHTLELKLVAQARETISFVAQDLPSYGYKTYWLYPRGCDASQKVHSVSSFLGTGHNSIENEHYQVAVDATNGTLTVTDKRTGAVFRGLNRFIDGGDIGDLYTYCPPEHDMLIGEPLEAPRIEVIESGPVRAALRISSRWALPTSCTANRRERSARTAVCTIVSDVALTAGMRRVDIHTRIENKVKDHRLRVLFPVPYRPEAVMAESTFQVCQRPISLPEPVNVSTWIEYPVATFPQKRFVDLSTSQFGLAILNQGLPECEVLPSGFGVEEGGTAVAITLLRCVDWLSRGDLPNRQGHAGPMEHTPEAQCPGFYEFDYALVPHAGAWDGEEALVLREAQTFTTRLATRAVIEEIHEGRFPSREAFVTVEPAALVVSAVKRWQRGKGIVVRLYNPFASAVHATVHLRFSFWKVSRANLLEECQEVVATAQGGEEAGSSGEMRAGEQRVTLEFKGGEIITLVCEE